MEPTWMVVVRPGALFPEGTLLRISPWSSSAVERIVPARAELMECSVSELEPLVQNGSVLAITEGEAQLLMAPPPREATDA